MTKLGEMLVEDGRKKGIQEGIKKINIDLIEKIYLYKNYDNFVVF